jgi:hypothetical protein
MSQRQEKLRLKIRTAEKENESARGRLRDVLIAGGNSSVIRAEIDDLHRRVESGNAELAEIAAAESDDRASRIAELAKSRAADSVGRIEATLDRLRPAKSETFIDEAHHD